MTDQNHNAKIDVSHLPNGWWWRPVGAMIIPLLMVVIPAFVWAVDISSHLKILESKIDNNQQSSLLQYRIDRIEQSQKQAQQQCDECIKDLNKIKYEREQK